MYRRLFLEDTTRPSGTDVDQVQDRLGLPRGGRTSGHRPLERQECVCQVWCRHRVALLLSTPYSFHGPQNLFCRRKTVCGWGAPTLFTASLPVLRTWRLSPWFSSTASVTVPLGAWKVSRRPTFGP